MAFLITIGAGEEKTMTSLTGEENIELLLLITNSVLLCTRSFRQTCKMLVFYNDNPQNSFSLLLNMAMLMYLDLQSQVTFIYVALYTIQIVSKQLYSDNRKMIQ